MVSGQNFLLKDNKELIWFDLWKVILIISLESKWISKILIHIIYIYQYTTTSLSVGFCRSCSLFKLECNFNTSKALICKSCRRSSALLSMALQLMFHSSPTTDRSTTSRSYFTNVLTPAICFLLYSRQKSISCRIIRLYPWLGLIDRLREIWSV